MNRASTIVYLAFVSFSAVISIYVGSGLLMLASPSTIGSVLVVVFAAIFVSELKQESIGQLYQALAISYFKTSEQAAFAQAGLRKVRTIRRIFLLSNGIKLVGSILAVYLVNEKQLPGTVHPAWIVSAACFVVSVALLCFARLWMEVSAAEELMMSVKFKSIVHARKEALLSSLEKAREHDFANDPIAESFLAPSKPLPVPDLEKAKA